MTTYKNSVLSEILVDVHPGISIDCDKTYSSILMLDISGAIPCVMDAAFKQRLKDHTAANLVPEETIQDKYADFTLAHNLVILRKVIFLEKTPVDFRPAVRKSLYLG